VALLAAPRPGERDRRRHAGAKQEHGDGGDQAKVAGQRLGLLTLVEINEQRPVRMAAQPNRNGEHGEMRHRGAGTVVDRDLWIVVALWNIARFVVELHSILGAREGETAGIVVNLVAKHTMVIAEIVEDAVDAGRQFRPGESADQRLRLHFDFRADARCRDCRIATKLYPADLARRDEGGRRDQHAEQHQASPDPVSLELRQRAHGGHFVSIRMANLDDVRLRTA
jgi:hypothetical protein